MSKEKTEKKEEAVKEPKANIVKGIEIGDPQALRPVELPLVVKPADGGSWKNEAQAQFAATLNAYAYRNPKKWEAKKDVLISQLVEIGENPSAIAKYSGNTGNLSFKNKLIEN